MTKNFDEYRNFYDDDAFLGTSAQDQVNDESDSGSSESEPKLKTFKEIMLGSLFGADLDSLLPMSTIDCDLKMRLGEWHEETEGHWSCEYSPASAKDTYVQRILKNPPSLDEAYFSDGQKVGEEYSFGTSNILEYTSSDGTAPTTAEYIIFRVQCEFPDLKPKTFMEYGLLYYLAGVVGDGLAGKLADLFPWPINDDGIPTIAPKTAFEWQLLKALPVIIHNLYSSDKDESTEIGETDPSTGK